MSTFLGLIEEIPGISVDRFDGENLNSSAYFLSHCHTDHMHGLSIMFFEHLKQYNKYLYCSPISKVFLETTYGNVSTCVKDIAVNEKTPIEYKSNGNNTNLFVTCVSAGHCPGSVMFLFEKMDKLILYTGDFRINPRDYKKLPSLNYCKDFNVFPKKFAKIYLDTTFLDRDFTFFPTREESKDKVCKVAEEWLKMSPRKIVVLECSALYGSEFLYIELSKYLKIPVHVNESVFKSYCRIPDLACHVTTNPWATPIHACVKKFSSLECRNDLHNGLRNVPRKKDILTIIPSVLKWRRRDTSVIGEWDNSRFYPTYNVCYSAHASFSELEKFIRYFEPEAVHPCVCPENVRHTVMGLLDEIRS